MGTGRTLIDDKIEKQRQIGQDVLAVDCIYTTFYVKNEGIVVFEQHEGEERERMRWRQKTIAWPMNLIFLQSGTFALRAM